jgi:hypothetical protein
MLGLAINKQAIMLTPPRNQRLLDLNSLVSFALDFWRWQACLLEFLEADIFD